MSSINQEYQQFLQSKAPRVNALGKEPLPTNPILFEWQADIVKWAIRRGNAAIFADCGLGKSFQQIEWIRQMKDKRGLIVCPLSVAEQTITEGVKLGVEITYKLEPDESEGIWITNYDRLHKFDPALFDAIVLDESSILKSLDGKIRTMLLDDFTAIPHRLCCTATPAPNDLTELTNHAEFLGVMSRQEMLATFFVHDSEDSGDRGWRLKKHARDDFWRWVAQWAVYIRKPSDLGYDDGKFILPSLNIEEKIVESNYIPDGQLFPGMVGGVSGRAKARRATMDQRIEFAADFLKNAEGQWLVWCGLNPEGQGLAKLIGDDAALIEGATKDAKRIELLNQWRSGEKRVMISKTGIFGFGLNFQHCHNILYLGLDDSFEKWYQSVRRCWRFGQDQPVNVVVVTSDAESQIVDNVKRKERQADELAAGIVDAMRDAQIENVKGVQSKRDTYKMKTVETENYTLMLGDCVERIKDIPDQSIGLSIFSPPFSSLYTYSASDRDMGNSKDHEKFFEHFRFLVPELLRVTKPCRRACVHVQQLTTTKVTHGVMGWYDFRADVVREFVKAGWIYDGEVVIDKNPQALRNGSLVLTPQGWQAIETLSVGDCVVGKDGMPTDVLGVWPHKSKQMYRVTFSDGVSIECDGNHLWTVRTEARKYIGAKEKWVTMRTDELLGNLYSPSGRARFEIPINDRVEFYQTSALPLDPYLLGVVLGDGCISQRASASVVAEPEIIANCQMPDGCTSRRLKGGDRANGNVGTFYLGHEEWHQNPILSALRDLGLQGKRAWEKAIPPSYKFSSADTRMQLLQGLMDTDGTCKKNGAASYSTVSKELADDVIELVRSLGGLTSLRIERPTFIYKGEKKTGRDRYIVTVRTTECPFRLARKAERWNSVRDNAPFNRDLRRRIVSIEPTVIDDCTCITVANDDGLFIADNFLVTHNSQAIRTKAKQLMFVQKNKDSAWSRPAMADYILLFRSPGENAEPITQGQYSGVTNEEWIKFAHPIWYDISESDTLNFRVARENEDEKHICPLQLETVRRCVRLWSNPGDTVLSPFMGIGTEGYIAMEQERRFVGIELKESYFNQAVINIKNAIKQENLFNLIDDPFKLEEVT